MVFRPGTVFAFYIEQENKYGIIQILHWGKAGYNIRVFYKLIDNLERKAIDLAVKTTDFYYIKDFYPFDLLNGKKVGHFVIPAFVTLPKYMRDCERKRNGELWWYVMEDSGNVKTYKMFDEKLKSLSPATSWGIEYIKKRWIEGFTLDNWHELAEKWYQDYIQNYEPHKLPNINKDSFIKQWEKEERISQGALKKLDFLLEDFSKKIFKSKGDSTRVNQSIKQVIEELNIWNSECNFIETEESEIIVEYICDVLELNHCTGDLDIIDKFREW